MQLLAGQSWQSQKEANNCYVPCSEAKHLRQHAVVTHQPHEQCYLYRTDKRDADAQDWGPEELGSLATPPEESVMAGSHTRRPDLSTAVENLMGLQQRAADAADRANKLQLIVDGPPQLEVWP